MSEHMMYIPILSKEQIQKVIIDPLSSYEKKHNNRLLKDIQNAIRVALMMVSGFRDILDDLNYDEDKLRELQFSLDDNYDAVEKVLKTTSDTKTRNMIENLLTEMAKLEMEIGDLILEHRHAS